MTRQRLYKALAGYALLALIAVLSLDGALRTAVLVLFAGLAVKSWIAFKKELQK